MITKTENIETSQIRSIVKEIFYNFMESISICEVLILNPDTYEQGIERADMLTYALYRFVVFMERFIDA